MRFQLEPVQAREYSPIREEVFSMLRDAILTGKLRPGDRLVERELAEQLGVSRTPVREAMRKLELENLVNHIPRKGVVVSEVSRKDIIEIFDIRACLEGLAARIAAEKITKEDAEKLRDYLNAMDQARIEQRTEEISQLHDEFNQFLLKIAECPRLTQMINSLSDYIQRFTRAGYSVPGRTDNAMEEHKDLVEALTSRDPDRAGEVAEAHIMSSKSTLLRHYEEDQQSDGAGI